MMAWSKGRTHAERRVTTPGNSHHQQQFRWSSKLHLTFYDHEVGQPLWQCTRMTDMAQHCQCHKCVHRSNVPPPMQLSLPAAQHLPPAADGIGSTATTWALSRLLQRAGMASCQHHGLYPVTLTCTLHPFPPNRSWHYLPLTSILSGRLSAAELTTSSTAAPNTARCRAAWACTVAAGPGRGWAASPVPP
jgi:hypothetical protein